MHRIMKLSRQASMLLAEKNPPLKNYIESVRKKHEEDKDYSKWDITLPLPKLPVPELRLSFEKYLRCIMPIIDEESYKRTQRLVDEFTKPNGLGESLQKELIKVSEEKDNWAYDWWLDDMYLMNKLPLPINSNPGMVFPRQYFRKEDEQLRYVTKLISGIMDYKLIIDAHALPIDRCTCREKGQPLCMEQYYRLFSSYRVPGIVKDKLVESHTNLLLDPEHIIVLSKNQIFVVDVIVNFTRLNDDDLFHQLRRIKRISEEEKTSHCDIGFLTTLPRNEWAQARNELMKDSINRDSLDVIERSIFVVCLDSAEKSTENKRKSVNGSNGHSERNGFHHENGNACESDEGNHKNGKYAEISDTEIALEMLHGRGSQFNSGNRWYDKTIQFIISESGACGLNYEHSPSEGIAIIELSEHLFQYMEEKRKQKLVRMPSICELPVPRKLKWKIDDPVKEWIDKAKEKIDNSINNLDFCLLKYDKFGRDFPKKVKTSPDSFIQLSMQLAYYNLYGKLVSTYESASTRRFRKGRVDNIRANSCETLAWVKSMQENSSSTSDEKFELFRKAVKYQTDLMIHSILGKGMDCHLLALKKIAEENGMGTPEIFQDESYRISNQFSLSTSQIPTKMDGSFMCYGPVVHDGYGCSYNPKPDYILFAISSFKSCKQTNTRNFAKSLEQSLDQMYELCEKYASN